MNTLKHILQNYEAKLDDKIDYLVEAGLFEEKKVGMLKRAVNKNPNNLTMAESKVLKEFVDNLVSQLLYEKQDHLSAYDKKMNKNKNVDKELPTVIILKRKAIRVYPDNQKIALYYSQALDRYISIPYGPKGEALGMTMNESIDPKVNPQDSNKIPSANPKSPSEREMKKDVDTGDILKMMKKNEPVNPRMNFAPSADPKMRIDEVIKSKNTAKNETSFRKHLSVIREERLEEGETWDKVKDVAKSMVPGVDAYKAYKEGRYLDAAGNIALDAATIGAGIATGGVGAAAIRGAAAGAKALKAGKNVRKSARIAQAVAKRSKGWKAARAIGRGAKALAKGVAGAVGAIGDTDLDLSGVSKPTDQSVYGGRFGNIMQGRISGDQPNNPLGRGGISTFTANIVRGNPYGSNINESNLSIIKSLSKSKSLTEQSLTFGENSVTINKGTAKKVMKVYNSLNESNKKKMENMLSESASSFKKAIQFAVRH